jgi:hypothetical protein
MSASPRRGATTKPATALLATVNSGAAWKWSMRIGAVTPPQAIETASTVARPGGIG